MTCQHHGCTRTLVVECIKPELEEAARKIHGYQNLAGSIDLNNFIEYFCPEHCQEHGYCWNCGFTQTDAAALTKSGLCQSCALEILI